MRIFIDSCSLVTRSYSSIHKKIFNFLVRNKIKLTVVSGTFKELEKLKHNEKVKGYAELAINSLQNFQKNQLLFVWKSYNKNFADSSFISAIAEQRIRHEIVVITQDKKLSRDLLLMNNLESQRGKLVSVWKISESGVLEPFSPDYLNESIEAAMDSINNYTAPSKVMWFESIFSFFKNFLR